MGQVTGDGLLHSGIGEDFQLQLLQGNGEGKQQLVGGIMHAPTPHPHQEVLLLNAADVVGERSPAPPEPAALSESPRRTTMPLGVCLPPSPTPTPTPGQESHWQWGRPAWANETETQTRTAAQS